MHDGSSTQQQQPMRAAPAQMAGIQHQGGLPKMEMIASVRMIEPYFFRLVAKLQHMDPERGDWGCSVRASGMVSLSGRPRETWEFVLIYRYYRTMVSVVQSGFKPAR